MEIVMEMNRTKRKWKREKGQKKDTNNRASETRKPPKRRKKIINKTSYFLLNSLNKSLDQIWKL